MFHVERHPIQKPPSKLRPAGDEIVNFGINHLQRQSLRERGRPRCRFTGDPNLQPITAVSHTNTNQALAPLNLTEQNKVVLPVPGQVRRARATKGLSPAQIRQRLQKTRLPGGVGTANQIEARTQNELRFFQTTKISSPKKADHVVPPL